MFSAHTQNKQQELGRCLFKLRHTCVINSVIGKGIEPHPTDGHSLRNMIPNNLSIDIETHDAFTVSDTCHAVWVKQGSQSLSTLYLYYTVTRHYCQVFSRLSFRSFSWKYFHCGLRDSSHSLFCSFVFMMMFFSMICDMHTTTWPTQAVSLVLSC